MQEAVATILDTMPKGAGGGCGLSREETVDRICEDLLSKVCQGFDDSGGCRTSPAAGCTQSICFCSGLRTIAVLLVPR